MSETHQTEKIEETDFQRTWRIKKSLKPLIDQHIKEMKKSAEDFTKSVNAMISKDGNPAVLEQLEDMFASAVEELQQGDYVLLVRSDDGDVLLLKEENWTFAVTWQTGILYVNRHLNFVTWGPVSNFTSFHCFRMRGS